MIFFLLNFLYELNDPPNNEEIAVYKDYLAYIENGISIFNINPSSKILLHTVDNAKWFTNESILFYNNQKIFSQRKQHFQDEMVLYNNNFLLGFGDKKTKLNKNSSDYKLLWGAFESGTKQI